MRGGVIADNIEERFERLRVWSGNDRRAPHKPLLALWAIGRCLSGAQQMAPFSLVDQDLRDLLRAFGPHRKAIHTEFPFWRLRNDGVWRLDRPEHVSTTKSGDAHRSSLLDGDIHGGLLEEDYAAFRADPPFARQVADMLIEAHFPSSYRDDILRATGFVGGSREPPHTRPATPEVRDADEYQNKYQIARRRKRHPDFRPAVLSAYHDQCAVCGLDIRLAGQPIAVEAAHIHWLRDAGPWEVRNGLALCVLHHRLFDRGAFTVMGDYHVVVATQVDGLGSRDTLTRFNGQLLQIIPTRPDLRPDSRYLGWHAREVFREPEALA